MWQFLAPAFLMGLAGSLHCLGMCGPIAMAIPFGNGGGWEKTRNAALYNLGRVSTYSLFGLMLGSIGQALPWFGWQQRFSVALGTVILVHLLVPRLFPSFTASPVITKAMSSLRQRLARVLFRGDARSLFATGLLNGLLPCGLVYMALTGAAVTGDSLRGMAFMGFFGMGTLPALLATGLLGSRLRLPIRARLARMYPALLMAMAFLLILRGLNLGIPGVSPNLNHSASTGVACHPG
jgi:sulfite exporter TauE/SafE